MAITKVCNIFFFIPLAVLVWLSPRVGIAQENVCGDPLGPVSELAEFGTSCETALGCDGICDNGYCIGCENDDNKCIETCGTGSFGGQAGGGQLECTYQPKGDGTECDGGTCCGGSCCPSGRSCCNGICCGPDITCNASGTCGTGCGQSADLHCGPSSDGSSKVCCQTDEQAIAGYCGRDEETPCVDPVSSCPEDTACETYSRLISCCRKEVHVDASCSINGAEGKCICSSYGSCHPSACIGATCIAFTPTPVPSRSATPVNSATPTTTPPTPTPIKTPKPSVTAT